MTAVSGLLTPPGRVAWAPWAFVLTGLLVLYVPSFVDLFHGAWASEKNAHGPIVMAVAFALLYYRVRQMLVQGLLERRPQAGVGLSIFGVGLLCYVLGRSQSVLVLEVGSLIPVLSGIVVTAFGVRTWSRMWFAFFFMLFMIPLPSSIVDAVTLPMKIAVSYAAEHVLQRVGYPVLRSGVMLDIGQYQLLVADACAGLSTLFTLEAMGLLYMNLVRHPSVVRNAVLAALIVPIAFSANTLRVVLLALITYHFGDAAGQGFLHGFSGIVLFLSALLLIVGVDTVLTRLVQARQDAGAVAPARPKFAAGTWQRMAVIGRRPGCVMLVAMLAAFAVTRWMTPVMSRTAEVGSLELGVPQAFGDWKMVPDSTTQAQLSTGDDGRPATVGLYDQVVMRTYVNARGDQMMLALAYAKEQRQDVKLHLPEICYPAQGYKVMAISPASLNLGSAGTLPGMRMLASGAGRTEAVTYWARVGHGYPIGGLAMRMQIFRDGLAGRVDDGILVRASTLVDDERQVPSAYGLQQQFLSELVAAAGSSANALVASR